MNDPMDWWRLFALILIGVFVAAAILERIER
jgi:hypothetical protein